MNRIESVTKPLKWFMALLVVAVAAGCSSGSSNSTVVSPPSAASSTVLPGVAGTAGANATNPTVTVASSSNLDTNVPTSTNGTGNIVTGKVLTATFNTAMNDTTITPVGTFTLKVTGGANVPGTVTMNAAKTVATFTPTAVALVPNTNYTATVTTAAKNAGGTAMPKSVAWSFMTKAVAFTGQAPVNLLTAGNYVIFSDTSIQNPGAAGAITGDIGAGPGVTSTAITGFGLVLDSTQDFAVSALIIGKVYAHDYTGLGAGGMGTTPANMNTAANDMLTAYNEAAGRTISDTTSYPAVEIGGQTIPPGLYKWTTDVGITTDVTLDAQGDSNAVWIFQIAQNLTIAAGASVPAGIKVVLVNGAKASNVFWQVGGVTGATLNAYSTFKGTILSAKQVVMGSGAVLYGTALAQTDVTMIANAVTKPAP